MPLVNRPREVKRARIEWYAWSAPVLFAEEDTYSDTTWSVFLPAHRAVQLGLTPELDPKQPYCLSFGLSQTDATAFVTVFGPMLEDHFYPEHAEKRRARDG